MHLFKYSSPKLKDSNFANDFVEKFDMNLIEVTIAEELILDLLNLFITMKLLTNVKVPL